jgi:hypothetical protein
MELDYTAVARQRLDKNYPGEAFMDVLMEKTFFIPTISQLLT